VEEKKNDDLKSFTDQNFKTQNNLEDNEDFNTLEFLLADGVTPKQNLTHTQ
jgi:hypothetical protein